eukprot:NODE_30650_length_413_cov_1.590909.p3 GENE.NODE_30650_length_413_cov_1.590909~~NODE_30650_length_413_cov_1.590909.p3  ORF type:complete len:81 (-),score=1.37 NODE_30650_length_413_cov_1.590909:108-350(-)
MAVMVVAHVGDHAQGEGGVARSSSSGGCDGDHEVPTLRGEGLRRERRRGDIWVLRGRVPQVAHLQPSPRDRQKSRMPSSA